MADFVADTETKTWFTITLATPSVRDELYKALAFEIGED